MPVPDSIADYADWVAGGPGAIYLGDGNFETLVQPTDFADLDDENVNVSLEGVFKYRWLFESDYYRSLITKARLLNPTPVETEGFHITLPHACIQRAYDWCRLIEAYYAPNVLERTNGQVEIYTTSYPEVGVDGSNGMYFLSFGVLPMAEIWGGHVATEHPRLDLHSLRGAWPDAQTHFLIQTGLLAETGRIMSEATGGTVLFHNLSPTDRYVFAGTRIEHHDDFAALQTRGHSRAMSDWLAGMGANPRFYQLPEVYTAMERGLVNSAVSSSFLGFALRWYELTDYLNGPLYHFWASANVISREVWNGLPRDLQRILVEEGAKYELEALRLAAAQFDADVRRNVEAGMDLVEFSPAMKLHSFEVARDQVLPEWLHRTGFLRNEATALFNAKVGPFLGLQIEPDGLVVSTPITAGPHAGKTIEEVFAD